MTRVAPIAALLLLLCAAPPAVAKDMNGKLGVGFEQSLGGMSGITLRYWPIAEFGLNAMVGVQIRIPPSGSDLDVGTLVSASLGGTFNFARSLHANLGVGLRGAIGFLDEAYLAAEGLQGTGEPIVMIEVPLVAEFFMSDNFSISLPTGVLITILPNAQSVEEAERLTGVTSLVPGVTIGIGTGSISGTMGVVYYF